MPAARRTALARTLPATALLLGALSLAGCGSTPAAGPDAAANQDATAAQAGAAATAPVASGVPLLRRTEDIHGAPNLYMLVLVNDAAELPAPVLDALRPDFATESVIFLGMGRQAGEGFGTQITGVRRSGDELTITANFSHPAGTPGGDATTPWSAVVVPRQTGVAMPLLSDFR